MFFIWWATTLAACSQKKENQPIKTDSIPLNSLSTAEEWKKLGNEALDSDDYNKAIECYQKAIEADSNYFEAYFNLGVAYSCILEFDKSIEYYNKAIAKNDTIEITYFSLGNIYEEVKDYDKAIEMFKKGFKLKQNPNSSEAHYRLGFLYAEKSNYIHSKAHIMRAAQLGDSLAREFFDNDSLLWKDPFLRPDYKQIKLNIENKRSNLYYAKLWDRFQQGDSTMTKEEVHHLYYGYVFDKDYSPALSVHDPKQMDDILKKENPTKEEWEELVSSFNESIKAEPFNCLYLYYQSVAYDALNKPDESERNLRKIKCLLTAQAYSGDGLLKETAIHIIAVPAVPHNFDYLFFNGLSLRGQSVEEGYYNVLYLEPNKDGLEEIWIDFSQPFDFLDNYSSRNQKK
jgi:tetratricopeptide (TPR) repeat protein